MNSYHVRRPRRRFEWLHRLVNPGYLSPRMKRVGNKLVRQLAVGLHMRGFTVRGQPRYWFQRERINITDERGREVSLSVPQAEKLSTVLDWASQASLMFETSGGVRGVVSQGEAGDRMAYEDRENQGSTGVARD